jgi:hypothetical protein
MPVRARARSVPADAAAVVSALDGEPDDDGRAPPGNQTANGGRSRPGLTYHCFRAESHLAPSALTCSRSL